MLKSLQIYVLRHGLIFISDWLFPFGLETSLYIKGVAGGQDIQQVEVRWNGKLRACRDTAPGSPAFLNATGPHPSWWGMEKGSTLKWFNILSVCFFFCYYFATRDAMICLQYPGNLRERPTYKLNLSAATVWQFWWIFFDMMFCCEGNSMKYFISSVLSTDKTTHVRYRSQWNCFWQLTQNMNYIVWNFVPF